jgi:AraC-like DNA-binding protein
MNHMLYRPSSGLAGLVDFLWAADDYVARAPRERVLPTGSQALIVFTGDAPLYTYADAAAPPTVSQARAVVCGARQAPLIIGTSFGPTVGVHFKPGGARSLFDVPAEALTGQVVSLEMLWGRAADSLYEQLRATASQDERVRLLERALIERLRRGAGFELEPVLRVALEAFEQPDLSSVNEVNRRTGLSPKRLVALFDEKVGLSPKTYWRVRRFRAALRDLELGQRGAALAHRHGYCDQAHFLRDFRAFSGACPRQYFDTRVVGTDHISVYG